MDVKITSPAFKEGEMIPKNTLVMVPMFRLL